MTTVGERIKEARKRKGLTQAELGEHIGLTAEKVSKIEHGIRGVGGDELLTIASVTGVRFELLVREPTKVSFRGKGKRTQAEIDEALAMIDRFSDNWLEAVALEEAYL